MLLPVVKGRSKRNCNYADLVGRGTPNDTAEKVADSIEFSRRVIPVSTRNAGQVLRMTGVAPSSRHSAFSNQPNPKRCRAPAANACVPPA